MLRIVRRLGPAPANHRVDIYINTIKYIECKCRKTRLGPPARLTRGKCGHSPNILYTVLLSGTDRAHTS